MELIRLAGAGVGGLFCICMESINLTNLFCLSALRCSFRAASNFSALLVLLFYSQASEPAALISLQLLLPLHAPFELLLLLLLPIVDWRLLVGQVHFLVLPLFALELILTSVG